MRNSLVQVLKSTLGALLGTIPGLCCWLLWNYGTGWVVFIFFTGAFIGLALTLPGVSGQRVLGETAGWIVAHNTLDSWGHNVRNAIAGGDEYSTRAASESRPPDGPYTAADFPCPEVMPGRKQQLAVNTDHAGASQSDNQVQFAVVIPQMKSTEDELRAIGKRLQEWQTANTYVGEIIGLDQLLAGTLPDAFSGILGLSIIPGPETASTSYVALVHVAARADNEKTCQNLCAALEGLSIASVVSPEYYYHICH